MQIAGSTGRSLELGLLWTGKKDVNSGNSLNSFFLKPQEISSDWRASISIPSLNFTTFVENLSSDTLVLLTLKVGCCLLAFQKFRVPSIGNHLGTNRSELRRQGRQVYYIVIHPGIEKEITFYIYMNWNPAPLSWGRRWPHCIGGWQKARTVQGDFHSLFVQVGALWVICSLHRGKPESSLRIAACSTRAAVVCHQYK